MLLHGFAIVLPSYFLVAQWPQHGIDGHEDGLCEDPGQVEGNVVFTYLDAFDTNKEEIEELKAHYRRGGLGDGTVKKRLEAVLKELIGPIRERRMELQKDPDYIMDILKTGTDKCRDITQQTLDEIKSGLGVFHF